MPKNFWDAQTPIAIAHRGGDGAGYDKRNTMAAFSSAAKLGYQYMETDVVVTKDGKVIVSHGAATGLVAKLRGTHSYKILQGLTYAEVRQNLQVGGETVITLEELLGKFPKAKFLLDPKTDEAVEPLAELLIRLRDLNRVCLASFHYERTTKLYALLGNQTTYAVIIGRNNWLKLLPPLKSGRLKHVEVVYLHHSFVSRPMLRLIHNHGYKVFVWTCNSALSIKHAIRCGADGIISDRTKLLKENIGI
jgi:glycerophosphoryl diester phosphodiesterase